MKVKMLRSVIATVAAIAIVVESATPQLNIVGSRSDIGSIYTIKTNLDVFWRGDAPDGGSLATEIISAFEDTATDFLTEKLREVEDEQNFHLVLANIDVKQEAINSNVDSSNAGRATYVLQSSVLLAYSADVPLSDPTGLMNILLNDEAEADLLVKMKSAGAIDSSTALLDMSFITGVDRTQHAISISALTTGATELSSAERKGLIVAVVCLTIALIGISFILIWSVGTFDDFKWPRLEDWYIREKTSPPITNNKTEESMEDVELDIDDNITTPGHLGANPMYDVETMIPGMTPQRAANRNGNDDDGVSELTSTSMISDTSRFPLGIRSIRKLNKYATPDKGGDNKSDKNPYALSTMVYS